MKFTVTRHEQHCLSVVNSGSAAAHRELSRSPNSLLQKSGCCIAFVLSGTLSPALEPIDVLLLLLPALLSRLLIANLPAYFLQDPFFVLDGQEGGGHFNSEPHPDELQERMIGGALPWLEVVGRAETPPPSPGAFSHLH